MQHPRPNQVVSQGAARYLGQHVVVAIETGPEARRRYYRQPVVQVGFPEMEVSYEPSGAGRSA